jgi:hypothetical protein
MGAEAATAFCFQCAEVVPLPERSQRPLMVRRASNFVERAGEDGPLSGKKQ